MHVCVKSAQSTADDHVIVNNETFTGPIVNSYTNLANIAGGAINQTSLKNICQIKYLCHISYNLFQLLGKR